MSLDTAPRGGAETGPSVAVFYLARGQGEDVARDFARFVASYRRHAAGQAHRLHVIYKGFADAASRAEAERAFAGIAHGSIDTDDLRYDIGAYADAMLQVEADVLCFFNTYSEILSPNWLAKLVRNLESPGVGLVSATGSLESLSYINRLFPAFPNPHLRSNAFALRRRDALPLFGAMTIRNKLDCFFIESGPDGLTRQVFAGGRTCLIVGADGRGFDLDHWAASETARQGLQGNLLVADNYTRQYADAPARERIELSTRSWGTVRPRTI